MGEAYQVKTSRRFALAFAVLAGAFAWAQGKPSTAKFEDFDRQVGPFEVKGQRFTVALHMKRVRGKGTAVDPDFQETLTQMEIKDAAGTVHYEKSFPYEVEGERFTYTTWASTQALEGKQGSGLLVTYGTLPSAPLGGESWQVFGLFNGKLVPFSKPIFTEGQLINDKPGERVVKTSEEPKLQGDVLRFRVWSGNFFVIVPLRILWFRANIGPAWHCTKMTARGPKPICELGVEARRVPPEEDLTFARLYPEADEGMGIAQHVVVKKTSRVEFLATEAEVVWKEEAEAFGLSVTGDIWLKVRIDGKEGWIHTQEDFQALGLPQAG